MPNIIANTDILFGGLIGSTVFFFGNWLVTFLTLRWKVAAIKRVLLVEIEVCASSAKTFCEAQIAAPLYRLPTSGFETGLRELLGAGALTEADARALIEFYAQADTLNRGLDQAAQFGAPGQPPGKTSQRVHRRNLMKAQHLRMPNGDLYLKAAVAVT